MKNPVFPYQGQALIAAVITEQHHRLTAVQPQRVDSNGNIVSTQLKIKYRTSVIEADRGNLKRLIKPTPGFKLMTQLM